MKEYKRLTAKGFKANNTARVEDSEGMIAICDLYNRLAELEDKIERGELVENTVVTYVNMGRCNSKTLIDKALKFDELKAKLENGTLIELPCKVGDTVYCIYRDDEYEYWIEEALVHDFIYTNYGEIDIGTECHMLGKVYRYCVCLTKSEAEAKLKELKGEV